jgi:hypothetical protein
VGVAFAAAPAAGDDEDFAGFLKVLDQLAGFGVANDRAGRQFDADVPSAFSGSLSALPAAPALGPEFALKAKRVKRSAARGTRQDHIAPFSAVPAVRPAARSVLFPPETHTTVSAVSGLNGYERFVNKFHSDA